MRTYSYRIMVSFSDNGPPTVSVAVDTYRRGMKVASDLVSMENVQSEHLWLHLHRASVEVYEAFRRSGQQHPARGPATDLRQPGTAHLTMADGGVQEPIPDL